MKLYRYLLAALIYALPTAAFAQCSGIQPAGSVCGNPAATGTIAAPTRTPVLGLPGSVLGSFGLAGNTSGTVTIKPQAAAGTYNFNLPTSAGSAGQPLLSGGGGSTPMKYGVQQKLLVSDYATCDGTADDTAGFISLATAASAARVVSIEFPKNATCKVWPNDASATANPVLMNLTNLRNSVINFNGSSFHSFYTGSIAATAMLVDAAVGLEINGYNHTADRGKFAGGSVYHITITNGSHAIAVNGMTATGGTIGVQCVRAAGSAVPRSYDVHISMDVTDVYYPGSFQFDCDDVRGTFKSQNSGRPYFPYNVKGHDVSVIATNPTSQMNIAVYANEAADTSATSSMKIRYINTLSTLCNINPIAFTWQQTLTNTAPRIGTIDVDLTIDIDQSACSPTYGAIIFDASYTWSAGTEVLGDPGHLGNIIIHDVRIKGNSGGIFDLGRATAGWGNNANVNFILRDIFAPDVTNPLRLGNSTGLRHSVENVTAPLAALTFDGAMPANAFAGRNIRMSNFSPTYGTMNGRMSIIDQNNGGLLGMHDATGALAGVVWADNSTFYTGSFDTRPFYLLSNNTAWWSLNSSGDILPLTTAARNLGATGSRINNIWGTTLTLTNALGVASGGTGLASGTSGGVLGFTATGTLASSAALTANGVVLGGGAGATPTATAAGTNGQMLVGQTAAAPTWNTMSGDCTLSAAGAITCTKVNGVTHPSSMTSGGVMYASSTSAVASSALLTANAIVLGGGAGLAPATLGSLGTTTTVLHGNAAGAPTFGAVAIGADVSGLGTGVATALAANVGSAGAPITFNGALGTPSSGTLTNATGLPLTTGVTGILPSANGGTGVNNSANLTVSSATSVGRGQYQGTNTNDSPTAGNIGEVISASVVSGLATALTTTVDKTVTSISLTAGDWYVSGTIGFTGATSTTVTIAGGSISTTNNTMDTSSAGRMSMAYLAGQTAFNTAYAQIALAIDGARISLSGTTTVYLVARSDFAVSTNSAFGAISGRRIR